MYDNCSVCGGLFKDDELTVGKNRVCYDCSLSLPAEAPKAVNKVTWLDSHATINDDGARCWSF